MAREMKDSEVEWIGRIPESWEIGQIGQLYVERKQKVSDTDYPPLSVTMKGILPQLSTAAKTDAHDDRKLVCKGDFAINSRSDRRGSCGISPFDGSVSLINTILMPRGKMHPVYYEWLFHSTMFSDEFYKWGHGIVDDLWTTNWQDMKKISVPIPPYEEQTRIASFLDAECARIDSVIEQTRASIEEYKKLKQAVITRAVTKGIRPDRAMKDSGIEWIGGIPEEWEIIRIKWLLNERNERSENGEEEPLSMSQKYGLIPTKEMDIVPNMASSFVGAKLCHKNDLVFNKLKAHLGVFAVSQYDGLVSPDYAVYYANSKVNLKYLEYLFKTPQYIGEFKKKSTGVGAGLTRLYTTGLYSIPCALPSLSEQVAIVDYLNGKIQEMNSLIEVKEQLLSEIEKYKKSLIYEYVTGKKEAPL
ncbi:MAG: restriction endonuclease subunit S [Thermoguttaceae bacterium]|nr:restriction endonuclease subunit S [Thermoguttaceae bacterium]